MPMQMPVPIRWVIVVAVILLLAVIYIWSKFSKFRRRWALARFINKLEKLGFYKYMDPVKIPQAKRAITSFGSPCAVDISEETCTMTLRVYPLESKYSTHWSIKDFIFRVAPFLATQGIRVEKVDESFEGEAENWIE